MNEESRGEGRTNGSVLRVLRDMRVGNLVVRLGRVYSGRRIIRLVGVFGIVQNLVHPAEKEGKKT